jgi:hypothetical protein
MIISVFRRKMTLVNGHFGERTVSVARIEKSGIASSFWTLGRFVPLITTLGPFS